jgi:protein-L-isoaspartate(D-aspartate) O-methyltransferase
LAAKVTALEENTDLAELARQNLGRLNNVTVVTGALAQGHRAAALYDVILIEGPSAKSRRRSGSLKDGGRLITVIGNGIVAKAVTITKNGQILSEQRGFDATVGELPGFAARKPEFVF